MTKSPLKLVAPATVNRTVTMPRRKPNSVYRTREHLTGAEVDRLIDAAKANRWGHRDATMILVAFRHGLRSSELVDLRWDQIDFTHAVLHVRRAKKGVPSTHPIRGDEMRALRKLQREQDPKSPFVFTSERGSPFTTAGFARMVERAGVEAKLGFPAHPHMLRHACGFALANKGHDTRALQARPQEHSAHGTLHRIVARSLQGATNQRFRTHHASAPRDRWTARESAPCKRA